MAQGCSAHTSRLVLMKRYTHKNTNIPLSLIGNTVQDLMHIHAYFSPFMILMKMRHTQTHTHISVPWCP